VSVTSYGYTNTNQHLKKNTEFSYFHYNIESAGNTLSLLGKLMKLPQDTVKEYVLFKVPFSQYLKTDAEFRYFRPINQTDGMAYRLFAGIAYPYGNSKSMPFEKQYYGGGVNDIRAWQAYSLGPGSYNDTIKAYPTDRADIKLEANAEYRVKLIGILEGALFIDAGNIWSINKFDNRPGALFQFNTFYKQMALGTGWGTRFDFQYFLLRIDLGFKLHDPNGNQWFYQKKITWANDFYPQLGIGYPF
jgi:outer membrane protein assembly factor BamA